MFIFGLPMPALLSSPDSKSVLIYGGTAPGIVAAVRAARSGLRVTLVTPGQILGGALPSLGAIETHYRGVRAPLVQEFTEKVKGHYRERYGEASEPYRICQGGMMITFEPHVAEKILRDWVTAEPGIEWRPGFSLLKVQREGTIVRSVTFFATSNPGQTWQTNAAAYVEASYEGDLMAAAGADCCIGRESREQFNEPSAGRVFTRWLRGIHPRDAAEGRLNLVTAKATTSDPLPGSTGEGDDNVQSYSYRVCLTDDPAKRRLLTEPPSGYDRVQFAPILLSPAEKEKLPLPFHHRFLMYSLREMVEQDHIFHGHALPHRKRSWNATNLTGAGKGYAAATHAGRAEIERLHREHALGLMWFLQNDPEMPADLREQACAWGLARDEFVGSDNFPPQLYVRETRRLVGHATFTEHDARLAPGLERAPIHADSVGITEFSLDSLACTTERLPGAHALCDGQLFQMEVSRPGQIPFGVMLPRDVDNLLVVTTVSATHVGWGTVRQTPTLMHLAESAAWAVVLATEKGCAPTALDITELQRRLVAEGVMISFFNDYDMTRRDAAAKDAQLKATRGDFTSYDANLPLSQTDS